MEGIRRKVHQIFDFEFFRLMAVKCIFLFPNSLWA